MASFKTNINKICAKRGTTLSGVCKELGLSTSKVSLWNNGSLPKEEMMLKLANVLKCSVMDFFADDEYDSKEVREFGVILDDDESDIIRVYRLLDRRAKHEFMARVYDYEAQYRAD